MPTTAPLPADVSVVIVNYRTPAHVLACLDALQRERSEDDWFDVLVVDGGSDDASADRLAAGIDRAGVGKWVTLLPLAINGGFGWANNQAIRRLMRRAHPPRFVHLLNPDALPQPGALGLLRDALVAQPRAASAGSLLVTADGGPQGSAFTFPTVRSEIVRGASIGLLGRLLGAEPLVRSDRTVRADWVTGASVMIRLDALRQVGLFDEGFFLYYEEVELMHRLHRAGWLALHVPASRVEHVGGASTGIADGASEQKRLPGYWYRSRRRYFARTGGRGRTAAAALAWLTGSALWRLRHALGFRGWSGRAPHEGRDFVRHGLLASRDDLTPAVPAWDSPVDQPPAWMVWRDRAEFAAPAQPRVVEPA